MSEDFSKEVAALRYGLGHIKGAFLAGGAITSHFTKQPIRDYDLYFKNKAAFLECLADMYYSGAWCVAVTPRAITLIQNGSTVYQLMSFAWFETAQAIFDKFDFSCCMAAIDLETDEFFRDGRFFIDLAKRELRFNHHTEFPLGSAMRVAKYQKRGYHIEDSELLKVLIACSFKEISTWEDLKNQIGGQYGEAVVMDTSKDFNVENAVASLTETLMVKASAKNFPVAASYDQAVEMIFGEPPVDERPPSMVEPYTD